MARENEVQLLQRMQDEPNPVKKAKLEIKLASLRLTEVQDAYSRGQIESGVKLLGTFVEAIRTSRKMLQESGRRASKQPEGFRDLEIALRENVRTLQDLGRTVSYFDRAPLTDAEQELDRMRGEVLQELFPGKPPPNPKDPPPPNMTTTPGPPPGAR
jgi:hypothetical protein